VIVPMFPSVELLTAHCTAVLPVPVTVAVNCWAPPVVTVWPWGLTVTVTWTGCPIPWIAGLKVPLPPQDETTKAAEIAAKIDNVFRVLEFMVLKSIGEPDVQAACVAEAWS